MAPCWRPRPSHHKALSRGVLRLAGHRSAAEMSGATPKVSPRASWLRTLLLAILPLAAGYMPARPLPHRVLAFGRTPVCRMGAEYTGLSYRELQAECKARGLKATGKTAVLRGRLAAAPAAAAPAPAAAAAAAAAAAFLSRATTSNSCQVRSSSFLTCSFTSILRRLAWPSLLRRLA